MAELESELRNEGPVSPERRRFLMRLSAILSVAIGALVGVPVLGYLLSPLIRPPKRQWIDVGGVDDFNEGETSLVAYEDPSPLPWAGLSAKTAIYVRRTGGEQFTVYSIHCTHLGCPVNWLATAELFLCPCHGGVFYKDGSPAAGPPERNLYKYEVRVEGGRLLVETRPLPPRQAESARFRRHTAL